MKKNLIKRLLCIVLIVAMLSGCELGSYKENQGGQLNNRTDSSKPADGSTGGTGDVTPPNGENKSYTVTLYYNLQPFAPEDAQIEVVWHGDMGTNVATLNSNGQADAGELDGDYDITLVGLPEAYSYDPSAYHVSADKRHADIIIVDIAEPISGDGGIHATPGMEMYTGGGCYLVRYEGTYRVTFTKPGQIFYFEYQPIQGGIYSVESWCNVYDDEINPRLDMLGGSTAFKYYQRTIDGGGYSLTGGFTKNFRYEISLGNNAVGNCFSFGIKMESKTDAYPITVDFAIVREGDYTSASEKKVTVTPDSSVFDRLPAPKDSNEQYNYADLGTQIFDGKNYRYDSSSKRYRVYDEVKYADNDGWGPYLMCQIKNIKEVLPCYSVTSLYEANAAGGSANNFLRVQIWDDELNGYVSHDYTGFIREYYAGKCNSDGRCYVTQELKEFLQLFAKRANLWTDGVLATIGSPEEKGYSASEDDMWLFACGFYENGR